MKLSIDFAFEGFRIIRHRPVVIPIWGTFLLISNGLIMALFFYMAWTPFMEFLPTIQTLSQAGGNPDMTTFMQAYEHFYGRIMPAYFLLIAFSIVIQAVISCAIYRTVLDRPEKSFGSLRLGADELRQVGVRLVFIILSMAIAMACEIAAIVVGGIVGLVFWSISHDLVWIGVAVFMLIYLGGLIWIFTKLSLYSVQTFDEKKINLFGSWTLTKGNSLTLFAGYLVAGILMFIVYVLCVIIFIAVVFAVTSGHMPAITPGPDMTKQIAHLAVPVLIAFALLMLIATPLMIAIVVGAPAAAYKALTGTRPKTPSAVF
jgi:hypothetical protein